MRQPLYSGSWRLPASHANFYIANAAVIVPTFNDPADRSPWAISGELFRDRPVVGIHAVHLSGFGHRIASLSNNRPGGYPELGQARADGLPPRAVRVRPNRLPPAATRSGPSPSCQRPAVPPAHLHPREGGRFAPRKWPG